MFVTNHPCTPIARSHPLQCSFISHYSIFIANTTIKFTDIYSFTETRYTKGMHWIQERLLAIASKEDIGGLKLVELVDKVGCKHASQIKHHKEQLIEKGRLVKTAGRLVPALATAQGLLTIPVLGEADCGLATRYAAEWHVDNLTVSPSVVALKHPERVYALVAKGESMNKAMVRGKVIENNDYVIVEKSSGYIPEDGDIVVSNIGGLANIKRFWRDRANNRIVLLPESTYPDFAPIIIDENDDYTVEGKVVDVVKGVKI